MGKTCKYNVRTAQMGDASAVPTLRLHSTSSSLMCTGRFVIVIIIIIIIIIVYIIIIRIGSLNENTRFTATLSNSELQ